MGTSHTCHSLPALQQQLLQHLADGAFHSGAQLGRDLGVSRAAVWKATNALNEFGLEVQAVRGRGYRLSQPLQLLQSERINSYLSPAIQHQLTTFDVLQVVDSTNAYLMRGSGAPAVCLAEFQTAGRGRRGRRWVSPYGSNLYLSLRWRFNEGMARLAGLSLAAGVAVLRTLRQLDISGIGLKWPNDIYADRRKLGGILLEASGESSGPCQVVVGIGLNLFLTGQHAGSIDQPWISLHELTTDIDRNYLAALLIEHLLAVMAVFERQGLAPLLAEWREADMFCGETVTLHLPGEQLTGVCRGIDSNGELLLEVNGRLQAYTYGEVSLRRAGESQ